MRQLAGQFFRFGLIGVVGFAVDTAVLYLVMAAFGLNPYSARLWSYLAAATTTWALNRSFTFGGLHQGSMVGQWLQFLAVNAVGGAVNYATFAVLISVNATFAAHPVLAVAMGALAGLAFNFTFSRMIVFRET